MRTTITAPEILERLVVDTTPLPGMSDAVLDVCKEAIMDGDTSIIEQYIQKEVMRSRSEIVCAVLDVIMRHPNPALTAGCLAIAAGLPMYGRGQADLARQHGIDRAAVCQRVKVLRRQLGLKGGKKEQGKR